MHLFVSVLQGGYAYLLIGQIVLVTLLFLALLWLVVQRTKEAMSERSQSIEVPTPLAQPLSPAPLAAAAPSAPQASVSDEITKELKAKIELLEAENTRIKSTEDDKLSLLDKVKYLESKLLEYEILQEEIGALSALKVENEQLKQKLVYQKSEEPNASKAPAPLKTTEVPPTPVSPISVSSEPVMDQQMFAKEPEKGVAFDPPPPTSNAQPLEGIPKEPEAIGNLDNLLQQIDELTKHPPTR